MRFKRENKGFSLVELIVVIAIFSVVGVVVGGFLLAASRSYSINANELNLQDEAQLVANQVQEMILDTAYGISYQYVVTDDTGAQLVNYMENDTATLPAGDLSQKDVYIYGKDQYYHIFWDKEKAELYLKEYEKNASGDYVLVTGMPNEGVLLGEFVSEFKVDLSKVASDRLVSFNILFAKAGTNREYYVTKTVSLRNNVLTNKPAEEVYNAAGVEFQPGADGMTVSPETTVTLWPGETQQYKVTLTCSRGGVPSQNASWIVASTDAAHMDLNEETKMNAGNLLSVGVNEESSSLALYLSAQGYDFDANTTKTLYPNKYPLEVSVRQIRNLKIVENQFEGSSVSISPMGTYKIKVQMEGENLPSNVTDAGGIVAQFTAGGAYATIADMTVDGLTATFSIQIGRNIPENAEIGLSFKPARDGFTDIHIETPVYKINNSTAEVLHVYNGDTSAEWLRLGTATTKVEFVNSDTEENYCNQDGTLKDNYSIRYNYRLYDSNYNLVGTAKSTTGTNQSLVLIDEFQSVTHSSVYEAAAKLSDKVFLQSGTVVVSAELLYNTAGETVVSGCSDNLTYFIPEATISFKRADADAGKSNMKSYITSKANVAPIYISFTSGFASEGYRIALDNAVCTGTEFGNVNAGLSDLNKNRVAVVGKSDAQYKLSANNTINFTYGGLNNTVSIVLASSNVIGTDYYVPLNKDEWTKISTATSGTDTTERYVYYIDDSHRMNIVYLNDQFSEAKFYSLQNLNWIETEYTMNKINKTWDLTTP